MIELVPNKRHEIIKRDGRVEPYQPEKLEKVIMWATNNSKVFTEELLKALNIKLNNRMHITKLYDETIDTAANMISDLYPHWEDVAKNLYLLKIHKDIGVKVAQYPEYKTILQHYAFLPEGLDYAELEKALKPERDKLFTFGGLNLFVQKYCLKEKGKLVELPQHTYMRSAIQTMYPQGTDAVIDKYNQISQHEVTEATPKMVNPLTKAPALFSCCMNRPTDSLEGIEESLRMLARESKFGGGDAWDVSPIRAAGAIIEGNDGKSSGVVPYLQDAQQTVGAYNQGSTRSSALVVYYNWFHYESPEIGRAKLESGKDEDRARKIKYAIKWNKTLTNAIKNNEDIYLIDPHKTQDMTYAYGKDFEEKYRKYSNNNRIHKRKYSARALGLEVATVKAETGNNYTFFTDNANLQDIGAGVITASNLCVTGDTKLLTKDGYKEIATLDGETVECWNGEEWSSTPIFKTGVDQEVLQVKLDNTLQVNATPYHKWYVMDGYNKIVEKRTSELSPGDKLIKFGLSPITHGSKELPLAYVNGFHSGDGTVYADGSARISLHDGKQTLLPRFSGYRNSSYTKDGRILNLMYAKGVLKDKFFIPSSEYSIASRVLWLEGYFDADGTLTNNNGSENIQIVSVHLEFLQDLLLMLQELGIHSTISKARDAGYMKLPANDGTGTYKDFWCKEQYRLLVAGSSLNALLNLGYNASRVMPTRRDYQREARSFVRVVSVSKAENQDTFCGTEPKRNKLMFNSVLTGNCVEMMTSYDPIDVISNTLVTEDGDTYAKLLVKGDMSLCNLASINVMKWYKLSEVDKRKFMYTLVSSMDNAIDTSFYTNPLGKAHSQAHRNLGIGISNYANYLATHKVAWGSSKARMLTHSLMEEISFYAIEASIRLAKERARCPVFKDTRWAEGLFPHELSLLPKDRKDLYLPLTMPWEELRKDLLIYGIRNSHLLAIAPTATSGKCINATEGVDAPRRFKTIAEGTYSLPFVVPNLKENREYYSTTFTTSNKDTIELAAIRQRFICMSQSVSLAYIKPDSAYEILSDIMYAEELGLKTLYYTHTPTAGELEDDSCEACGS